MNDISRRRQFKIIIEQDEDGFFVAHVPALPGCYTQAQTLPDLSKRVREAISLCLDVAKKDASYRRRIVQFGYEPSFIGVDSVTA